MDQLTKLLQIGSALKVRRRNSLAVQINNLQRDGKITELRIHNCHLDEGKEECCDLGVCAVYKSLSHSILHFTITSIQKDPCPRALTSN